MFTALGTGGVTSGLPNLCTAVGCVALGQVVRALMLAGSAAFAVAILALLGNVQGATAACRRERERLEEEERAFRRFARRVDDLEPSSVRPQTDGGRIVNRDDSTMQGDGSEAVLSAYQETAMAVDHYKSHYGESLETHMGEEFGPDVVSALTAGAALTPELKHALVSKAHIRADQRANVRKVLDRELEALQRMGNRLEDIERRLESIRAEPRFDGFPSLTERWRRLRGLEDDCAELLDKRQETLREQDEPELREYVYTDLDVRHPVLADIASLLNAVRAERSEVRWMLARTV